MDFIFDGIANVLSWFYELTGNYALAIMLLTLAIMILLTPLTLKGTRSMIAMQRLQPEMKKLQAKYKDDRQKLNEEMLKFYREHNINPVGGCLPLLLQSPVFIVLYRVLHGLTNPHGFAEDMGKAFGLAAHNPNAIYEKFGTFDPGYLDSGSQLYKDLSNVREMKSFGLDLATSASQALSQGIVHALPYLLLIAIIGATAWYQQRQIQGRNPQMAQVNPQQQMLMKIFPYFLPVISFTLPAGIVLYFLVSNLYRIGQQAFITRTMYRDKHGNPIIHTTATETSSEPAAKPKGLFAQLRETVSDSGPKVGPNANGKGSGSKAGSKAGGAKAGASKSGAKKKANPAKATGAKPKPGTAKKQVTKKAAPPKRPSSPAKNEAPPAKGQAGKSADQADQPAADQNGGGGRPSRAAPAPDAPEGTSGPAPAKPGSSPSRQPPAPNPNRARAKKKRR